MRVVIISKAMLVNATHSKGELLGSKVDLFIITPNSWPYYIQEEDQVPQGFKHIKLNSHLTGKNHFHFYLGLKQKLEELKPDLVHIDEEPYSLVTFQSLKICKVLGIPALCFTWQNIFKRYPLPFSFLESYVLKNINYIICGNQESETVIKRKGFQGQSSVIPQFGVDINLFKPDPNRSLKRQLGNYQLHLGYVGRIIEEKGIQTVLEAIQGLPTIKFTIVGSGDFKPALQKKIQELNLENQVFWIGGVGSKDVAEKISSFDSLILPSLTTSSWKEQFGRILIEAMASKVAVIGSDSGEIPNVIGKEGLIFPEGDALKCANCIKDLLNDDVLEKIQEAGYNRVIENYTQEKIVNKTLHVYKSLISSWKAK